MKKLVQNFAQGFVNWFLGLRKTVFFRATQRTLILLSPMAIMGSFFTFLHTAVFAEGSLLYSLLNMDAWLPDRVWNFGMYLSTGMTDVTLGLFGIYATYLMSLYTARLFGRDSKTAGLTAIASLLFISYIYNPRVNSMLILNINRRLLDVSGLLVAILVGYGVGQVFHWLGQEYHSVSYEHVHLVKERTYQALVPIGVSLAFAMIAGSFFYFAQVRLLQSTNFQSSVARIQSSNRLWFSVPWTILVSLLGWLGIGSPLNYLGNVANSGVQVANMNAALTAGSSWNVPYKYLGSSLLQSYGMMGGAGMAVALMIVIFLYSKDREELSLSKLNILPVLFNCGAGFFTGLPVVLNPVYAIPFALVPGLNMLLAAGTIALHLIPASGYMMLPGTPGLLISFVETNGSIAALIFTFVLVALDACVWLPFYKLSLAIEEKMAVEQQEADQNEA